MLQFWKKFFEKDEVGQEEKKQEDVRQEYRTPVKEFADKSYSDKTKDTISIKQIDVKTNSPIFSNTLKKLVEQELNLSIISKLKMHHRSDMAKEAFDLRITCSNELKLFYDVELWVVMFAQVKLIDLCKVEGQVNDYGGDHYEAHISLIVPEGSLICTVLKGSERTVGSDYKEWLSYLADQEFTSLYTNLNIQLRRQMALYLTKIIFDPSNHSRNQLLAKEYGDFTFFKLKTTCYYDDLKQEGVKLMENQIIPMDHTELMECLDELMFTPEITDTRQDYHDINFAMVHEGPTPHTKRFVRLFAEYMLKQRQLELGNLIIPVKGNVIGLSSPQQDDPIFLLEMEHEQLLNVNNTLTDTIEHICKNKNVKVESFHLSGYGNEIKHLHFEMLPDKQTTPIIHDGQDEQIMTSIESFILYNARIAVMDPIDPL